MAIRATLCAIVVSVFAFGPTANAQDATAPPSASEEAPAAPTWTGLPFSSLADYERLIPIGMSQRDLVAALGRPETVMPGRGADEVFHYAYPLEGGGELRAVIILRERAVFIRRLYVSSPDGGPSRVN
ncbi:MAG: hypothetical protein K2P70_20125 [Hyphomonadaceae bacterium]|nr:hypothetical protein [Hyphomonadaceae bacterium]